MISYRLLMHIESRSDIYAHVGGLHHFQDGGHFGFPKIKTCVLVLIGAVVWHVLMKQKCDGIPDGITEARTDGRRPFHSPPF